MRLTFILGLILAGTVVASACDKVNAVKGQMTGESSGPVKLPPPGPPTAPAGSTCSFEESQRLAASLEKAHAARLRELADANTASNLTMVPMRLHYDADGRIDRATVRVDGYTEFVAAAIADAKTWQLEGIKAGSSCDVALRIPAAKAPAPDPATAPAPAPRE